MTQFKCWDIVRIIPKALDVYPGYKQFVNKDLYIINLIDNYEGVKRFYVSPVDDLVIFTSVRIDHLVHSPIVPFNKTLSEILE